jgi:hypothetical protein
MPTKIDARAALKEGVADALGFLFGALAGWQLGLQLGFDFINTPGYGVPQLIGLVLIVVGCGVGRAVARKLLSVNKA